MLGHPPEVPPNGGQGLGSTTLAYLGPVSNGQAGYGHRPVGGVGTFFRNRAPSWVIRALPGPSSAPWRDALRRVRRRAHVGVKRGHDGAWPSMGAHGLPQRSVNPILPSPLGPPATASRHDAPAQTELLSPCPLPRTPPLVPHSSLRPPRLARRNGARVRLLSRNQRRTHPATA